MYLIKSKTLKVLTKNFNLQFVKVNFLNLRFIIIENSELQRDGGRSTRNVA